MKKITLLIATVILYTGVYAQAPKFVLFEHFTQASCGPCAQQNPGFDANILTPNTAIVRHIAYHTSWPGVDEMNAANPSEVADRVTYYNVSGVPTVALQGNYKQGAPGTMTQADVDYQFSLGSPVKIELSEIDNGSTRDLTVTIKTLGNVPSGTYKLYTAIVENPRDYATPPGSNGETHFPNVFRKMYPSTAGESVTLAPIGSSITFNYTYTVDPNWVAANIKAVSFLQNTTTKEVLNVGTVFDPIINYSLSNPNVEVSNVGNGVSTSFTLTSGNTGNTDEDFIYTMSSDAPADWISGFTIDGNSYTNTATITATAGNTSNIAINITPGATRGVATYTLSVSSVANPSSPSMTKKVYVISGVTDLIVNNLGGIGDGVTTGDASNWGTVFTNGLIAANNQGYASTNNLVMQKAIESAAFTGINNVYYNAGWTFPALTDEGALAIQSFLDAGGNLFISGQDIGWEINDAAASPYSSPTKINFYKNYLHAKFISDGSSTNSGLTTVVTDPIYSDIPSATINNFYGGQYLYPDQIDVNDTLAKVIFKYATSARIGGIRAQTANYKIVYVAPGMEMLSANNSDQILKRAHDWFYGYQGTASLNELGALAVEMGQNYPNPSSDFTVITFERITENMQFELFDITGKSVYNTQLSKGTHQIRLNTQPFASGKYIYRLTDSKGNMLTKTMIIN